LNVNVKKSILKTDNNY